MSENFYTELKEFETSNIKDTFEWIQDEKLRELFSMRGEPNWDTHVSYFEKTLKDVSQKVYAIYTNQKHIGNCGLKNIKNGTAEIWLYIGDKAYLGKKLGKIICRLLLKKASENNINYLYLYVLDYNIPAIKVYKDVGFKKIEMNDKDEEIWKGRTASILKMKKILMNSQPNYFIIGGSTLQYNFVKKVKEMGFITHVFDYNSKCRCAEIADYFHCISIDDKDEIYRLAKKFNPVGIQTVATEVGNITACYVGEKMNLNTNSYETSLNTTDKSRMKKIFAEYNIPNARYIEATDINDVEINDLTFPVVIKPADRSAGRGVTLVRKKEDFEEIFEFAKSESYNKKVLIEELMSGKQFSIETISCKGKHQIVAFTEEYLDGSDDFIENQQMIPARLTEIESKNLSELINKTLEAFNIRYGCCHIEVKLTDEGFKVIEIASRMGGWRDVLVKFAYGDDFNEMLIVATLNKEPIVKHEEKNYSLVKMIFSKYEYDFYKKIKQESPNIIVHDEVKEYNDEKTKSLADAKGFYYITVPRTADINYYIEGSIC